MIVLSFFERSLWRNYIYFFIISTNFSIIKSTAIYLHFVHYAFILAFPLKGASGFINAITFKGLSTLLIPDFFSVTFIY